MKKRVFIERKDGFDIEKQDLTNQILKNFDLKLTTLRYIVAYDIFNLESDILDKSIESILTEKNKDNYFFTLPESKNLIAYEFLPGQFDQRADSAEQCIRIIRPESNPVVKSSTIILFDEIISNEDVLKLKKFLINAVESREKDLSILDIPSYDSPLDVEVIRDFIQMNENELKSLYETMSLAMNFDDFTFIQHYFKSEEQRDPFETEIRVLDTYWSDHCRHTTFETEIVNTTFGNNELNKKIEKTFVDYLETKKLLGRTDKPITLMDIATINARYERDNSNLEDLEISEEVNAASIYVDVDVDGTTEKWLFMFKNETHNHPTEIEPFGGASTCIGGAIRDPLSGRSYVYSAMRVTGAANITESIKDTIPGKLPQSVISKEAAHGYSSYGNQIGLATTFVDEVYHNGYKAKRMEIGAVCGAVKAEHVRRESPSPGDIILLLGGKTGRDGIGGATGSSKEHTTESLDQSSAEVQKGNAPEERKIQRLFRNPEVTKLIKKSNDFGAGGVSVAIGELADGLIINLDKVPTKYKGINGTELAISESQERMAVVIDKHDVTSFMDYCRIENIEVTEVATVTKEKRLVISWRNKIICDMSRAFIDTSGVRQKITVECDYNNQNGLFSKSYDGDTLKQQIVKMLQDKNVSSKQGLVEMFDSTIGRTTVLSPFGGKYKLTKAQTSIHKFPVKNRPTNTVSMMAYGFNPFISEMSPYHGSTYAIIESISKIIASGGSLNKIRFTFQEYFERLNKDPKTWSKPFTSLLGAYNTLKSFNLAAIGGKDSMSGTYHDLTVPPTLVSFAVCTGDIRNVISPELKSPNSYLYLLRYNQDNNALPDFNQLKENYNWLQERIIEKQIKSAYALGFGGVSEAIIKASFGNKIGVEVNTDIPLFDYNYGAILIESPIKFDYPNAILIGRTTNSNVININNSVIEIDEAIQLNQKRYSDLYPITHTDSRILEPVEPQIDHKVFNTIPVNDVTVLIPVFPGTNCEYDCEAAFVKEGAIVKTLVFNNQSEEDIKNSLAELATEIDNAHIFMLAGGFSSGDEPDGSGKFIASVLRNDLVAAAIKRFLDKKHLILGICNGFQALVKAGLLPNGEISPIKENSPTLFKNTINRHVAKFVNTKVSSLNSPWLSSFNLNDTHTIPMSHGEGKFIIDEIGYKDLVKNNLIAFQYVDEENNPTYNPMHNPNGSSYAIEGIISKDGLILGKMGHSERYQDGLFLNIHGNMNQNLFKNGVDYFRKVSENIE